MFWLQEELEKHIVWLSNKKYIDEHNANSEKFGYRLAMNQFGDMVSRKKEEKKRLRKC